MDATTVAMQQLAGAWAMLWPILAIVATWAGLVAALVVGSVVLIATLFRAQEALSEDAALLACPDDSLDGRDMPSAPRVRPAA